MFFKVSKASSASSERLELRHAPKSKRRCLGERWFGAFMGVHFLGSTTLGNLGRRMRAVKEEEEDEKEERRFLCGFDLHAI